MLDWAFVVGSAFAEAVDLILRGPRIRPRLGAVLHALKNHNAAEEFPEAVLRLLDWLLEEPDIRWPISTDIEQLLLRLPRKKSLLPTLNSICQHLASSGYAEAADLKRRIQERFNEE